MKITGILSLRDGSGLEYPYPPVVRNLANLCDQVIVGVDPQFPADKLTLEALSLPNVVIYESAWDMSYKGHGLEIARQMDLLTCAAKLGESDWVVVLQADELLHEKDFPMLREFMSRNIDTDVTGFSTERIYFWENLSTIRTDWNADLVRIFKPLTYSFLAEGTSKDGMYSGPIASGKEIKLPYKVYHYSRVDSDPSKISRRVRNLDGFFHTEDKLIPEDELPDYDFITREHDNFSRVEFPAEVEGKFKTFSGTHPHGVKEWYNE